MSLIVSKIGRGVKITQYDDFERVNTTYRGASIWKQLSPMNLGKDYEIIEPLATNQYLEISGKKILQPISQYYPDGVLPGFKKIEIENLTYQYAKCQCFEAYWQYCGKIYAHDIDKNGILKKSYFERRGKGLLMSLETNKPGELRRAFPKSKYGVPIASYYNGIFMDWVTSRIKVYCPIYSDLVKKTQAYKQLDQKFKKGINIQLLDPDGHEDGILTKEKIFEKMNCKKRPFGHSYVIASLLLSYEPWNI